MRLLIGDKGYDGDDFRAEVVNHGAKPVIPNRSNRVNLYSFSKRAYIATRYDKLARNFLSAVQLAAIVAYWI
jgi:transposase